MYMWQRILILFLITTTAIAEDSNCPQGQVFDNTLNRCVLSRATVSNKTEAQECGGLEGAAARECFEKNIEDDMADVEEGKDPESSYIIPGIITLGSAYILFGNKEALKNCGSTSMWLMLGGGVTSLMGEFLSQRKYKKKVKKLMSEYKEDVNESTINASEEDTQTISANQSRAFDFQIEQERARMKAHNSRKTTYNIAFGLYTASAVAAMIELFTTGVKGCQGISETPATEATTSIDYQHFTPMNKMETAELFALVQPEVFGEYAHIKNMKQEEFFEVVLRNVSDAVFPSAHADTPPAAPTGTEGAGLVETVANNTTPEIEGSVNKAIANPGIRAAFAGVLALYSKKIAGKAGKLAKKSENRIEALTEIRNDFLASGGAGFERCSESDRRSPSKPFCFCYDEKGQQDQSKSNNQTCTSIWNNSNLNLIAGTYGKSGQDAAQGVQGCLRRTGQPDPGCQCRNADQDSNQACTNIAGTLSLGGLNGLRTLPAVMNDTNAFTGGRLSSGQLANGSNLNQLISDSGKIKDQLGKNPETAPTLKKLEKAQNQLERSLAASARQGLSNGSLSNPFGGALGDVGAEGDEPSADDVIANTNEQLAALENRFVSSKSTTRRSKKNDFNFDLGTSSTGNSVEVQDDKGIMNKEFSYNSINENEDTDIFKIISVRYQRSGLKRLFDEENSGPVDEANDVSIHGDQ